MPASPREWIQKMNKYSIDFYTDLYRKMMTIRECEEHFVEPILKKEILCPVHLCSGQEAVAVGACSALKQDDYIFGGHRSHGHYLAKGGDLKALVAEIYGKETGCSKGRGGSMHLIAPEKGMLGAAPIVAGTISLAVGAALSSKIMNEGKVVISFFGDGATGEGVLYEALNFAKIQQLPIIFLCENNLYSTHMPIERIRSNRDIQKIAKPFDIKSWAIDGNDVITVYETVKKAVNLCRNSEGPVFIECKTYRLRGHVGPDDNIQGTHTDIRPEDEIEAWVAKDPVTNFENFLLDSKIIIEKELKELKKNIHREIEDAFEFASNSPYPDVSEVIKYVFK